ncbi:cytochrome P450 [Penicillium maclennaniae]|uniref:cytochrome P450 n=1 Tax=Penicillium maclennaniae TaxID=1343394 RepID=UPI002540A2F8|nr:cytochrome P450 [Penicillium maclennaniae]KAJ5678347.1 cytochrome P450 [Penicillium maclennaniae]
MKDMAGQIIDLGAWLQWYAFDVIGAITFQRRFGFMEKREDVIGMIAGLEAGLRYAGVVSQIPRLHHWFLGNIWVAKFMAAQPFVKMPDPLRTMVRFTQECIDNYDRGTPGKHGDRPDFLAWLRSEEAKGRPMSNRDMMNHHSNNLLAGSDTTAISLRAMIYYLVQNYHVYMTLQKEIDDANRADQLSDYATYAECLELPCL